ncbi:hypothetical protein HMPREF0762_00112 [Slackia exigua ATCC 700122]|uniref:Uncharacterized protein n=1 Tax=Slackia exigua (strain ATCC 700122 / DSM 15923 / CIP 105133 / JCM 11022 / KCTC 5966 / S-7) TaxID=649764 RepID=D0WE88_SLAES|nr:hypothetical protein HMPREF0762_00112 [Slackia exigua ATCC 700122]
MVHRSSFGSYSDYTDSSRRAFPAFLRHRVKNASVRRCLDANGAPSPKDFPVGVE